MHHLKEEPILWLQEFIFGMIQVVFITMLTGLWTLFTIRIPASLRTKLILNITGVSILSVYTSTIFSPETHMLGCISAAVPMSFTAPLQAFSWVIRKSKKPMSNASNAEVMLRIAIPAALPSAQNPAERPRTQLIRGVIYIALGNAFSQFFYRVLEEKGLIQVLGALFYIICVATGALNISSAMLGAFGIYSGCPFRRPLLSRNLTEFWGRRWNQPVSDSLRVAIYEPLLEAGYGKDLASLACFFASAVAHEFVLLFCGVRDSRGEWFTFFMLCGGMVAIERRIGKRIGPVGEYLFAVGSFFSLFYLLFIDVTIRSKMAERGIEALESSKFLLEKLMLSVMSRTGS